MNQKYEYLNYLEEMKQTARRKPLVKDELEQITEAFLANKENLEAARLVKNIIATQMVMYSDEKDSEKIDLSGLAKTIRAVVANKNKFADQTIIDRAEELELHIAAELINNENFHEFQNMKRNGFNPKTTAFEDGYTEKHLIDFVDTLSGAKYLDFNNLIRSDYFTNYNPEYQLPPLCRASDEQIDFYIAHGADVNAVNEYKETVLDMMLLPRGNMKSHSVESAKKIYEAGGISTFNDEESAEWLIKRFIDASSDYTTISGKTANELTVNYGKNAIKNSLDNIAFFLEKGIMPRPKNLEALLSHPEWFEKYPETMKKIFSSGINIQEKLKQLKNRAELRQQPADMLAEKQKEIEIHSRDGGFRIRRRNEFGEQIDEKLLNPTKMHMGKTGNSQTGKVSFEQREVAQNQAIAAYKFMKKHREETRK